jgi:polar amino acid transport system substrate-binding protein
VVREIAPTGVLRAAINLGNPVLAQKNPGSGKLTGVSVDLANELGHRLGLQLTLVPFGTAGQVFEALAANLWDVAFLAIDPMRATKILFTAPYVVIEASYLVRDDSPFHAIEDFDRPGVRIAVGKGAAYDLYLSRNMKHAELIRSATSAGAIDLFLAAGLQAAAGVRQALIDRAETRGGLRVIEGRFMVIEQALGTPKARVHAWEYLQYFIELMKQSGFVAAALERSGQREAAVAPPSS